jgi:hypothetical protein
LAARASGTWVCVEFLVAQRGILKAPQRITQPGPLPSQLPVISVFYVSGFIENNSLAAAIYTNSRVCDAQNKFITKLLRRDFINNGDVVR